MLAACSGGDGASRQVRFIDGDPDPADVLPPVEQLEIASIHREQVIEGQEPDFSYRPSVTDADADAYRFTLIDNPLVDGDDTQFFVFDTDTLTLTFADDQVIDPDQRSFYSVIINAIATINGTTSEHCQIIYLEAIPAEPQTYEGTPDSDTLEAGGGDDSLFGYAGDDILISGRGEKLLDGGTGFDTASYQKARFAVEVNLGQTREEDGTLLVPETAGRDAQNDVLV